MRVGFDGHPRRPPSPGPGGGRRPQPRSRWTRPVGGWRTAGLADQVEIRMQDYRDLRRRAVRRHLVHRHVRARRHLADAAATSRPSAACWCRRVGCSTTPSPLRGDRCSDRRSFVGRYVFPDGELLDVAEVVRAMQEHGFEVRDVESLREHYSRTLHTGWPTWSGSWDEAVSLVGLASGQHLEALHGGVGQRLRRRGPGHPPGARRGSRTGRDERHAPTRRRRGSGT